MAQNLRQFVAKTVDMSSVSEAEAGGILAKIGMKVIRHKVRDLEQHDVPRFTQLQNMNIKELNVMAMFFCVQKKELEGFDELTTADVADVLDLSQYPNEESATIPLSEHIKVW